MIQLFIWIYKYLWTIVFLLEPGQFGFEAPHCYADKENGTVTVEIHRDRGCDGEVALEYSTM